MTGLRFNGHQPRMQQALVVEDGVERAQYGVARSLVGEDPHRDRLLELGVNFFGRWPVPRVAAPAFLLIAVPDGIAFGVVLLFDVEARTFTFGAELSGVDAVALALLLRLVDDQVAVAPFNAFVKRPFRLAPRPEIAVEGGLQLFAEVALYRRFGRSLQPAVEGRVHLNAVAVQVVRGAVCFGKHPITLGVFRAEQFLQFRPEGLAEIRCQAFVVADFLVIQPQGEGPQRIGFGIGDAAVALHLPKHHIPPVEHELGTPQRIEQRAVFEHAHQHGRFMQLQFAHVLVEVDVGGGLHPDRLVQEIVAVEVEGDDFVFGVEPFEARRDDPLFRFLEERPLQPARPVVLLGEELFGQLLGEGRPAAALAHVCDGPCQTDEVDAAVAGESGVLGADEGVDEVGW